MVFHHRHMWLVITADDDDDGVPDTGLTTAESFERADPAAATAVGAAAAAAAASSLAATAVDGDDRDTSFCPKHRFGGVDGSGSGGGGVNVSAFEAFGRCQPGVGYAIHQQEPWPRYCSGKHLEA